jgi:hypothetical protein
MMTQQQLLDRLLQNYLGVSVVSAKELANAPDARTQLSQWVGELLATVDVLMAPSDAHRVPLLIEAVVNARRAVVRSALRE